MAHRLSPIRCHQQCVHPVVASAIVIALRRLLPVEHWTRWKLAPNSNISCAYTYLKLNTVDQASSQTKWTKERAKHQHQPFLKFKLFTLLYNCDKEQPKSSAVRDTIDQIGTRIRTDRCNGIYRAIYIVQFRTTEVCSLDDQLYLVSVSERIASIRNDRYRERIRDSIVCRKSGTDSLTYASGKRRPFLSNLSYNNKCEF